MCVAQNQLYGNFIIRMSSTIGEHIMTFALVLHIIYYLKIPKKVKFYFISFIVERKNDARS